jgi:predicted lipoprotein with Yx(FWY)xxD motif
MRRLLSALACAALVAVAGCSTYGTPTMPASVKVADGVLTNSAGMTLYTFDRDTAGSGKSECNGPCAVNWPPLLAAADAQPTSEWTIVTRADGARQWAYKGKPLYLWAKDMKPGDRTGDNVNNVWRIARQ